MAQGPESSSGQEPIKAQAVDSVTTAQGNGIGRPQIYDRRFLRMVPLEMSAPVEKIAPKSGREEVLGPTLFDGVDTDTYTASWGNQALADLYSATEVSDFEANQAAARLALDESARRRRAAAWEIRLGRVARKLHRTPEGLVELLGQPKAEKWATGASKGKISATKPTTPEIRVIEEQEIDGEQIARMDEWGIEALGPDIENPAEQLTDEQFQHLTVDGQVERMWEDREAIPEWGDESWGKGIWEAQNRPELLVDGQNPVSYSESRMFNSEVEEASDQGLVNGGVYKPKEQILERDRRAMARTGDFEDRNGPQETRTAVVLHNGPNLDDPWTFEMRRFKGLRLPELREGEEVVVIETSQRGVRPRKDQDPDRRFDEDRGSWHKTVNVTAYHRRNRSVFVTDLGRRERVSESEHIEEFQANKRVPTSDSIYSADEARLAAEERSRSNRAWRRTRREFIESWREEASHAPGADGRSEPFKAQIEVLARVDDLFVAANRGEVIIVDIAKEAAREKVDPDNAERRAEVREARQTVADQELI